MSSSPAFVEVAFPLPMNRTFHYQTTPEAPAIEALLGARVLAPFGRKSLVGYVVATTDEKPSFATKRVFSWLDAVPFIDSTLLDLARWMSETYLCSLGEALACIAPTHLRAPKLPGRLRQEPEVRPDCGPHTQDLGLTLNQDQEKALTIFLAAVEVGAYHPFLLRGITDSGKTVLYVRTIDRALAQGRQALFLLPEIALTPPFIDGLTQRYGADRVGVWHSGIKESERYRTWQRVLSGEIQVLLGARSAVFAPFPRLGVIIVDEEHEASYKQEDRPRYHTREVALHRAQQTQSVLIMGSATPSLESYWNAKQGTYTLVELTSRVEQKSLPPVTLIDRRPKTTVTPEGVKQKRDRGSFAIFSEPMKLALEQRLARREQVMLFINRRGFNPFVRCSTCGWVARCPRCSLAMAVHLKADRVLPERPEKPDARSRDPVPNETILQCHACLRRQEMPIHCPQCKGLRLRQFGIGTQRVEEEVRRLFPFVKTARLDRDIARFRRAYETVYRGFAEGRVDVLVGTQMIAKGFHFPKVTLVGIVDADVTLHLPDFRSAERTFELIAQVAGRTGRGDSPGQVLVQTHHPDHYALQAAKEHDFLRFYEEEMTYRQTLNYPPYCRLVNILVRATKEPVVQASAEQLYQKLQTLGPGVEILGPAPAPYSRLRGQFRYQILLKGTEAALLPYKQFLRSHKLPKAFMSVDVDPSDLL